MPQRPRRAVLACSIVAALLLTLIGALPAGAAPPDRLIVFDSDRGARVDLWTMRSDGSGLARLTNDKELDELAEWSPNRKQIAWTRGGEESPTGEIWVMNADGTGRRQVTSNTFSDNAVAWSPDGRQLAYRVNPRRQPGHLCHRRRRHERAPADHGHGERLCAGLVAGRHADHLHPKRPQRQFGRLHDERHRRQ